MSIKTESMPSPATVIVANQAEADARIPGALAKGPVHLRIDPMEGPIDLAGNPDPKCRDCHGSGVSDNHTGKCECICIGPDHLDGILSVTVSGGEKPIHPDWVRKIRNDCAASGVPFTFLSWGEWMPEVSFTPEIEEEYEEGQHDQGEWHDIPDPNEFFPECVCGSSTAIVARDRKSVV